MTTTIVGLVLVATLLLKGYLALNDYPEENQCGYQSCNPVKEDFINVHFIPHTHDDVGWVQTMDQYYQGTVRHILDSVTRALQEDKKKRFIYVETSFFWKWWNVQDDDIQRRVKQLVGNGQLEFISGGWVMNDEATTHYQSTIDQLSWGFRRLNDTFGECGRPKVGWQIDPFGHSREMASILAQSAFDGLLLGRIDYQEKKLRFHTKTAEFVWQGSANLGNTSQIFTSVMPNTYNAPKTFCLDIICGNPRISSYNVQERWKVFAKHIDTYAAFYNTSNVIMTMGGDFTYRDANYWFGSTDQLIRYANSLQSNGSKYHLLYSTPSCYLKAVHEEAVKSNISFYVKTDDFFPYAEHPDRYWTGYFTSKPALKRNERIGNNFLQICKQLFVLGSLGSSYENHLDQLREAMGVLQHHDAITGTAKEHVVHDYTKMLSAGVDECQHVTSAALSKLVANNQTFEQCLLANISQCEFTENHKQFVVTVYNPLSRPVSHYVRLPVIDQNYQVIDPNGNKVNVEGIPISQAVLNIPGRVSNAAFDILFLAKDVPPIGFKSYYLSPIGGVVDDTNIPKPKPTKNITVGIDENTGLLVEIRLQNKTIPLAQTFKYYKGAKTSGAYIFTPTTKSAFTIAEKVRIEEFKTDLVTEIRQTFSSWLSQIIRVYNFEDYVEFDWLVGPLPWDGHNGVEVINRFTTNLKTDSTFYTDSNGREMIRRVRDWRNTFKSDATIPVSTNYYPVTSKILMRDSEQDLEVAILNDRAQGGSSLKDGQIELMVHRNSAYDDNYGVEEALHEQAFREGLVVRGSHYLFVGPHKTPDDGKTLTAKQRDFAQTKLLSAWTFLSPTNGATFEEYKSKNKMEYCGLQAALPDNVQILTLEPWRDGSVLLRLEHVLEKNEDPFLSKSVTVDLKNLFKTFDIMTVRETTLGANQWLEEGERLQYSTRENLAELVHPGWTDGTNAFNFEDEIQVRTGSGNTATFSVTLNPMQIRTFIVSIQMKT